MPRKLPPLESRQHGDEGAEKEGAEQRGPLLEGEEEAGLGRQ